MVAANGVAARTFEAAGVASIRRIVRVPKRWDRIVEVAAGLGTTLPDQPDSKALNDFLLAQKQKDPDHFPDLLAHRHQAHVARRVCPRQAQRRPRPATSASPVQDYTHSTAPNRRFPDMVTQAAHERLCSRKRPSPTRKAISTTSLSTAPLMEDGARKVERDMQKRIAAVVLHPRIGQSFPAIVTGVNKVRHCRPHP